MAAGEAGPGEFTVPYAPTDAAGRTVAKVRNPPTEVNFTTPSNGPSGILEIVPVNLSGNDKLTSKLLMLPTKDPGATL